MEAAVKSDKRLRNKTAKGLDHFYLGLLAKRKILRGGETRLLLKRDPKRDQAKSKALELFSQYFVVSSRAQKKNQCRFFTRATPLVATKMVNFVSKRNARYTSVIPFPTILSVFTPTLTVCKAGRRSIVP